ncbi:MAG: Hsp20/alpha crystallin family protein [Hydrogenophilus thermoluteolus]
MTTRIMPWNPFRELEELQNRLAALMSRSLVPSSEGQEAMRMADWAPLVDIEENENGYLIKADLPGLAKDDVHVTLENGVLSISGERKQEKEEKDKKYHRVERVYGRFVRSFTLPEDADPDQIFAQFKDGVLEVRIGKSEAVKPKRIEIKG